MYQLPAITSNYQHIPSLKNLFNMPQITWEIRWKRGSDLMAVALRSRAMSVSTSWQCLCCKSAWVVGYPDFKKSIAGLCRMSGAGVSGASGALLCSLCSHKRHGRTLRPLHTKGAGTAQEIDIWSFNLRTELVTEDDLENSWQKRRDGVAALLCKYRPAIVCAQEATVAMLSYLSSKSGYDWKGISRQPGHPDECAGFLFDSKQVELLDHSAFWLRPPGVPDGHVAWDAKLPRTCEVALFKIGNSSSDELKVGSKGWSKGWSVFFSKLPSWVGFGWWEHEHLGTFFWLFYTQEKYI